MMTQVKTAAEIEAMRQGGRMLAQVLQFLTPKVVPGVRTKALAAEAAKELKRLGGEPAFLGFKGFPDVICISVNDEVVHGIPGDRVIADGDLVGLDFGVTYQGMICDGAITVPVGKVSDDARRLLAATKSALEAGINQVREGAKIGDISNAIERRLRQDKLAVIEELVGHGVGHELHEEPAIPNLGAPGRGMTLKAGMTLAIEPMASLGGPEVGSAPDGWTILTVDGSLAAQFEHTVLVTNSGAEVLTKI